MAIDWSLAPNPGLQIPQAFEAGQQDRLARELAQLDEQRKQQTFDQAQQARTSIANALGRGDYTGAAAAAYAGGLDKTGDGLRSTLDSKLKVDDYNHNRAAELAYQASQFATPEERIAFAQQGPNRQVLANVGIDVDHLRPEDVSDAMLAQFAQYAYTYKDRVADQNTAFSNDTARINATKPVTVSEGGALVDPQTGQPLYVAPKFINAPVDNNVYQVGGAQGGTNSTMGFDELFRRVIGAESSGQQFASDGSPLRSSAGALGVAQIMPSTGPEAAKLAGLPWDPQRLATDKEYGLALGQAYLKSLYDRYGGDAAKAAAAYNAGPGRVDRAIRRAEASGGNWTDYLPEETQNYVPKVTGQQQQSGRQVRQIQQGVPKESQEPNGGLSEDALNNLANYAIAHGGQLPPGYSRNKGAVAAVQDRMAVIMRERGLTMDDVIAQGGMTKADLAALKKHEEQSQQIRGFEDAANRNADLALQLSTKVPNGSWQSANRVSNWFREEFGNTDITNLNAALETFVGEYAKVTSGNGQTSDTQRQHARDMINSAQSPQQLAGVIATLKKDMENRTAGLEDERKRYVERLRGGGSATGKTGSRYRIGQTAVNKQTGQRMVYTANGWQPTR